MTPCPRCTRPLDNRPARSRTTHNRDIPICTPCGHDEARRDARQNSPIPPGEWPITGR